MNAAKIGFWRTLLQRKFYLLNYRPSLIATSHVMCLWKEGVCFLYDVSCLMLSLKFFVEACLPSNNNFHHCLRNSVHSISKYTSLVSKVALFWVVFAKFCLKRKRKKVQGSIWKSHFFVSCVEYRCAPKQWCPLLMAIFQSYFNLHRALKGAENCAARVHFLFEEIWIWVKHVIFDCKLLRVHPWVGIGYQHHANAPP